MEPYGWKLGTLATLNKFKKNKWKNRSVMPAHAECAKRTFSMFTN